MWVILCEQICIFKYLDPIELWCLTQINHYIRHRTIIYLDLIDTQACTLYSLFQSSTNSIEMQHALYHAFQQGYQHAIGAFAERMGIILDLRYRIYCSPMKSHSNTRDNDIAHLLFKSVIKTYEVFPYWARDHIDYLHFELKRCLKLACKQKDPFIVYQFIQWISVSMD